VPAQNVLPPQPFPQIPHRLEPVKQGCVAWHEHTLLTQVEFEPLVAWQEASDWQPRSTKQVAALLIVLQSSAVQEVLVGKQHSAPEFRQTPPFSQFPLAGTPQLMVLPHPSLCEPHTLPNEAQVDGTQQTVPLD
jgi:hypothetical protein